ncbi:hypothetical protein [Rhodovarius sp.]|uniref:hypothetical protein n=1 Tax=Rhodovarius sp. TaxID=2972673 RepID=UPI0034A33841
MGVENQTVPGGAEAAQGRHGLIRRQRAGKHLADKRHMQSPIETKPEPLWNRFTESEDGETALGFVLLHFPSRLAKSQGFNML